MIKKKRILLSLIVVILCVSIAMLAFACNKDKNTDEDEDTKTEDTALFTNGTFTQFTKGDSDSFPVAPTNWTGTPGSTSSSSTIKTPQDSDSLSAGVISVGSDYDSTAMGITNPAKPEGVEDNYVLMINNKVATAYSYVSSSTTVKKDSYYELTFWVKTVGLSPKNEGEKYGAYIYVKGSAYAQFEAVDTEEEWKQFKIYFRGSNTGDKTFTLTLGLGEGDYTNGHMVKGYAYFDNVVLKNLTDVEEGQTPYTEAEFNALEYTSTQSKCDMRTIDGNFNYVSSVATLPFFNVSQLTGTAGSGSGTTASTGSTYLEKGILDMERANFSKAFSGYNAEPITLTKAQATDLGDKVVTIHNKQLTAYKFKDNVGMLIQSNKYYKITLYARTYLNADSQAGAYIALNSASSELKVFEDLNTNEQWKQYTFYVEGNQYDDNTLYVSMSLGMGGSGDKKWAKGVAFFDDLTYEEVKLDDFTAATNSADVLKYSYKTEELDSSVRSVKNIVDTQYEESFDSIKGSIEVLESQSDFKKEDGTTKLDVLKITNSKLTSSKASTIYKKDDAAAAKDQDGNNDNIVDWDSSDYKDKYEIKPNTAYKVSFWVKTENLNDGGSASVELFSYDPKKQSDYDSCKTTLSTMSSINDTTLESFKKEAYSNYALITMYVLGDTIESKYVGLSITFGTGSSAAQSASLVSGTFYLTNLRIAKISYDDYSAASTGTTTFKYSFVGSGASSELSANGTFEYVDMSATRTLYGDDADTVYNANGKLVKNAVPTNWTITNSKALTQNAGSSVAGVIDVNNFENKAAYGIDNTIYDSMDAGLDVDDNPNVLLIDASDVPYLGYKSNTVSLSANSFYVFSVYAKSIDNKALAISVDQSGSSATEKTSLIVEAPGTNWKHYLIYVQTGITSTSVTVTLYAGSPLNTADQNNQVLFTLATYSAIDKAIYDKAQEGTQVKKIAWFTDNMDVSTTSATDTDLATPANWSGASVDTKAPTTSDDLAKGVFNQLNSNWETIAIDPDETSSFATKIFTADQGDSVLAIYNKQATSYTYTSTSFSLEAKKYYKVSIQILTKDIARLSKETAEADTDTYADWKDKNEYATATVTLTANNKTYTFGKSVEKDKTRESFTGDTAEADYNEYVLAKARLVNPNEWTTYTYYIAMAEDVSETVSATLKLSLGGKNVSYWETGYLFADNFTVEEIDKDTYEASAPSDDALDPSKEAYSEAVASKTYKIAYTNEDAEAEEEKDDDEEEEKSEDKEQKNWLWLYITSGVIGGILVIILVIYIIKKYAPKKSGKKFKKTLTKDNSTRGKFGD